MCNLDKVKGVRGYQYSCCRQKFHQVLAAPCVCVKDGKGKPKKMLLCVDKSVQILRSKNAGCPHMMKCSPGSGGTNMNDNKIPLAPNLIPGLDFPVFPDVLEPAENDPKLVPSTNPPISWDTMDGNSGKSPDIMEICGLCSRKLQDCPEDGHPIGSENIGPTTSCKANESRCSQSSKASKTKEAIETQKGDQRTSNTEMNPDESKCKESLKASGQKCPMAPRTKKAKSIEPDKSPSASRRNSPTKISIAKKNPSASRRNSKSNSGQPSKSPAVSRRNSQTNISKPSKSPSVSRRNSQTNISKPSKSPSASRRNSQTNLSVSASRRNSQTNISKPSKSPGASRRNSQTNLSVSASRRNSQTIICKGCKSPSVSRRTSKTNIGKLGKSPSVSRRTSKTNISKLGKSPSVSRRNSQTHIRKANKSPAVSKTPSLIKLSKATKSPVVSATPSLTKLGKASKTSNLKEKNLKKGVSPKAKSIGEPTQTSLVKNQSISAQESLLEGMSSPKKPNGSNGKENDKPKEPFRSCNCKVVPEKSLVSETNLCCKCCEVLYSKNGKPNNAQLGKEKESPKQMPKQMPKQLPKQSSKQMVRSNKGKKSPRDSGDEKALVKASPKRKKIPIAKPVSKTKELSPGVNGSPKVSTDDDGIWFECNLPFRVNVPFPLCMQNFFGIPGISLNKPDPKNSNQKAIMPATNGKGSGYNTPTGGLSNMQPALLASGFQSEAPSSCNNYTCPKRKLGRRVNKTCPCETATQTGQEESDPLLSCLEQIKDKLENLSPQAQGQTKSCGCCMAEKGTNVRERSEKCCNAAFDSPERSESSHGKNKKSKDAIPEDPAVPFVLTASESAPAKVPQTENSMRASNGGYYNSSQAAPNYMSQPQVFPTQMHYHPFPMWNYPMYTPRYPRAGQPPPNWQAHPLGTCVSYRSLIKGEEEKVNCINHMAYPKQPLGNPYLESPESFLPFPQDQGPESPNRSLSGHSVDYWQAHRGQMESDFVKNREASEESIYSSSKGQHYKCHTCPGNNLSNAKISQRSIMKRPSYLGAKLSSTHKKSSSKFISFKDNEPQKEASGSYRHKSSRRNRNYRELNNKYSKSAVPRRDKSSTDRSDLSESNTTKIYLRTSYSSDSSNGSRKKKRYQSDKREAKHSDRMSSGAESSAAEVDEDMKESPIDERQSFDKNDMPGTSNNIDSNINDSENVHQRAASGMDKLERTVRQYSKFSEAISKLYIPHRRSLSAPATGRHNSQAQFLRQQYFREKSPKYFKEHRRGRKSPGRGAKIYLLQNPLTTTKITKYEMDQSELSVFGALDLKTKKKSSFIPRHPSNLASCHKKSDPPMVLVPFRVERSELLNGKPDHWNNIQLQLAVVKPPKNPRICHRRLIQRNPVRYIPHRSASGEEFKQEDNTNLNRNVTNPDFRQCEIITCDTCTKRQSCQRGCNDPTRNPSYGNTFQGEPSGSRNNKRPTPKSSYNSSPELKPIKSLNKSKKSSQQQDCKNSYSSLKSKSRSSVSQKSSRVLPASSKSGVPRSGPSTPPEKKMKKQSKRSSVSSIGQSKVNNSVGKKKKPQVKKPPYYLVKALSREAVEKSSPMVCNCKSLSHEALEKSSPMVCNCTPHDQRSIASIKSGVRPTKTDSATQKDRFPNGKRSSDDNISLTSGCSSRSQYSTASAQSTKRETNREKYSAKAQSSNSSVGYGKAYSNASLKSKKSEYYCPPKNLSSKTSTSVESKVSARYRKYRDPDSEEEVVAEAYPSYTRIEEPKKESDEFVTKQRSLSYTLRVEEYRRGDAPGSEASVAKKPSRLTKKPSKIPKVPSCASHRSEPDCLCDPNYQSPDEDEKKTNERTQRRRADEDYYKSGCHDTYTCNRKAQERQPTREYHSSSEYRQLGNSSQAETSHHSRVIAPCLPNCTGSKDGFKRRPHQAKANTRSDDDEALETVTLMQPRRFRSTDSTRRDRDAVGSQENLDTTNTVLMETRIPCDRENLMQTCGRPPCNFHRLQYSGVPPAVEQRNMYMRPPIPQFDPRRRPPNDGNYLIDPRDHLPAPASAPIMGNSYPMPMMNTIHHAGGPYPSANLHGAPCRELYSCPEILKNNIRLMPKGFYEHTLQKYNITKMDSDFQPPSLRSDIHPPLQVNPQVMLQPTGSPDRQFSNHSNRPMMVNSRIPPSRYNQPPLNPFQAQTSHSTFGSQKNMKLDGFDFCEYQI
ncbi:uncharacterized protein Dana_GF26300, isoform B [Drosophila ananassae]|uniref:Uncharacterized protein, isoform B n=1 Tax=Drosophila ananassae TaxID=7217 RepID=A0A0P8ZWF5_DROAN|nr:serine/arginine repetitive matrix protein 2 isoform X2 [Drosophila ananassae]KPU78966.1 uncharacterized protein Dana_GF26300, isoform B [Drosophila ananassae]